MGYWKNIALEEELKQNEVDDKRFWQLSDEDRRLQQRNNLIFFGKALTDKEMGKELFKKDREESFDEEYDDQSIEESNCEKYESELHYN